MGSDSKVQGWPCRGLLYDTRGSPDRGDFFLEKLMIRVIFRPAAKAPRLTLPASKHENKNINSGFLLPSNHGVWFNELLCFENPWFISILSI